MSFLDDQATGQIGIGEKASLSTLTRRRRKRKRGQAPTGAETYSLLPQDEFSNLVSSPTDIQRVGIGNLLQAQGTAAGDVPNVFDEYVSAAPRGTTLEAIYYQPPDDEDDPGDDDDLPSIEDDPYVPDPGLPDFADDSYDNPNYQDPFAPVPETTGTLGEAIFGAGTGPRQDLGRSLGFNLSIGDPAEDIPEAVDPVSIFTPGGGAYPGGSSGMYPGASTQGVNAEGQVVSATALPSASDQAAAALAAQNAADQGRIDPSISDDAPSVPGGSPSGASAGGNFDVTGGFGDYFNADGGVITKSKAKNKKSFMSMKGK